MKSAKTILLILFTALPFVLLAQVNQQRREKIESMKIGFLTERLDLTPEEAKTFWPVYNKYSAEVTTLRKSRRESITETGANYDQMPEAELEKIVDSEIIFRQNELDIVKKYHPQFKNVLPVKKVAKLYRAEEEFKKKLLEMLKNRRAERRTR